MINNFYTKTIGELYKHFRSSSDGLKQGDISSRIKEYGKNIIETSSGHSLILTFFRQFQDSMIIILITSALISRYLGEWRSAVVLGVIVIFNAMIGLIQEYKADRITSSLASLVHPNTTVRRDGERKEVSVQTLVPGDIVMIQEGDAIPADIRLIQAHNIMTNDFALTGESNPVRKFTQALHHETNLGDRNNMCFMGTTVAHGKAQGLVVATGSHTILGQIASLSRTTQHDMSPLQKELANLSKKMTINVLVIGIILFAVALLIHLSVYESFLFALGICMSLVPQGMPAQISVALSLASARLSQKQVVVKKLSSVETLGSTTIICTDKTGTLTKNQMTVQSIWIKSHNPVYTVSGVGYAPHGHIIDSSGLRTKYDRSKQWEIFFKTGILASSARIAGPDKYHKTWYTLGDPTEGALITLAQKAGFDQDKVAKIHPEYKVLPFDSTRKRMSSIRQFGDRTLLLVKGAPDSILGQSTHIFDGERVTKLTSKDREYINHQDSVWAQQAYRNLGFAYRDITNINRESMSDTELESNLIFTGLVSMIDPPRPEVARAMRIAYRAGINVAIITGDYALTAEAIAKQVGLDNDGKPIVMITGKDLKTINDADIIRKSKHGHIIFSRTSPEDKLRIVSALKDAGEIVAVTGDGINDAPALKKADIGVAMGLTGTDVSKDASDLILLKDNFSDLVNAIREGRLIFQNLRKTILSSITSNGGELFIVLISLLFTSIWGWPIAITPILILCIDLIGEMGPLTALTWDPDYGNLMRERPRNTNEHILNKHTTPDIIIAGFLMGAIPFVAFTFHLWLSGHGFHSDMLSNEEYAIAISVSYLTLLFCQYANIMSRRVGSESVFQKYTLTNRKLRLSILISLAIVSVLFYIPVVSNIIGTAPLSIIDRLTAGVGGLLFLFIREGQKKLMYRN